MNDKKLLSADIPFSDGGVYKVRDDLALVQSVDFFTPVVDDPYLYGQIAAANALSDVYAMGGRPLTALNVLAFPACRLGTEPLTELLKGGADKVVEAGAVVVGGHSVEDDEPKYGLAVTGEVHPDKMVSTRNAQVGDRLVLTKPLGTGVLTTALKGSLIQPDEVPEVLQGMARLNRIASEAMMEVGVHSCTDVTGFGLLGHAVEMAHASDRRILLETVALPEYPKTDEMIAMGMIPGGTRRNRDHYLPQALVEDGVPREMIDLVCDPQTSGGLLIAVSSDRHKDLLDLLAHGGTDAWTIGKVEEGAGVHLV